MEHSERMKIKVGTLITTEMLQELNGCMEEVEVFDKMWPDGLCLRLKNLKLVAKAGLDVYWFATEILSDRGRWSEWKKFHQAEQEYDGDSVKALWEIIKKR
jgi:hypothetical protein